MQHRVVFDGDFYQAMDIGKDGGRHAVIRKGKGIVLMTTLHSPVPEREMAIAAAQALDEAEKAKAKAGTGLWGWIKGLFG